MAERIRIFDTTLRDGEQSPGCSMDFQEKLEVARQLERLRVDVIEAGFPIASSGDFAAVKAIADTIKDCTVVGLARALPKDIDQAYEAVKGAASPRIHTFIATSDIHMQYKLRMQPEQVLDQAEKMVAYAYNLCGSVEFSAEDASRSDPAFLYRVFEKVIAAGACVINVADTVGYITPREMFALIKGIKENVPNIDKAVISVHCHNDLGMALANTLAAVEAGARQVECTINGIGERAGNAALEEVVMILKTRRDVYAWECGVDTTQIYRTSRLVSSLTGVQVQPNKAIVGANAFAHESGIHQHGVLANKRTYEIMTPESIGLAQNRMVLGKHSGRHAFEAHLNALGYFLPPDELDNAFAQFKALADKKKVVTDKDIEAIVHQESVDSPEIYVLERFVVNSGNTITSTAAVRVRNGGGQVEEVATGDGPVDAAFKAIDKIVGTDFALVDYSLHSVTEGKDAQGEVTVRITRNGSTYNGRGLSTDVVEASVKAYLNAINKMLIEIESEEGGGSDARKADVH